MTDNGGNLDVEEGIKLHEKAVVEALYKLLFVVFAYFMKNYNGILRQLMKLFIH